MAQKHEKITEYVEDVLRTDLSPEQYVEASKRKTQVIRFDHALTGMTTELGELADIFKRHIYYNTSLDENKLKEEAGDFAWYFAVFCDEMERQFGIGIVDIFNTNIEKLKARYPDKFTEENAVNRDLDKELKTLTLSIGQPKAGRPQFGGPECKFIGVSQKHDMTFLGEPVTDLNQAVHQLIGRASMLWSETPSGVFESTEGVAIASEFLSIFKEVKLDPLTKFLVDEKPTGACLICSYAGTETVCPTCNIPIQSYKGFSLPDKSKVIEPQLGKAKPTPVNPNLQGHAIGMTIGEVPITDESNLSGEKI